MSTPVPMSLPADDLPICRRAHTATATALQLIPFRWQSNRTEPIGAASCESRVLPVFAVRWPTDGMEITFVSANLFFQPNASTSDVFDIETGRFTGKRQSWKSGPNYPIDEIDCFKNYLKSCSPNPQIAASFGWLMLTWSPRIDRQSYLI